MPIVHTDNEDTDEENSLCSTINSDEDLLESACSHTHRSCSRYAACNKINHQHSSTDSSILPHLPIQSKPVKGDIQSVENQPGHRKKFDGIKWRRICCIPDCTLYLNGGIYFENWLCRKHYLLTMGSGISNGTINPSGQEGPKIVPQKNQRSKKPSTKKLSEVNESHKRGDIMLNSQGIRQKYDGYSWRSVCNYNSCISYVVRHGYCHRHDMEIRKKKSNIPLQLSKNKSQITRVKTSPILNPKKGDIQMIRQLWNGTKWYSLCHYYTRDCPRRSGGKKHGYLCDIHYREYLKKQKDSTLIDNYDQILLSPTMKRKKLIIDEENLIISQQSQSTINTINHIEQCIQTDVTYPLESTDLRQGCIFIDDNENDQYQSPLLSETIVGVKKEDDYIITRRNASVNFNDYPFDCKLELTKIEI
ncbi:hypothetical protein I4U23_021114 [Adineta vaga]|nr:hypothetical protein I4U23_021114 [Adineta vaga]